MEIREIEQGLKKPGKTKKGLAAAIGHTPPTVTAILKGERQIKLSEVPLIRKYLELENVVPIVGSVGASSEAHFYGEGDSPAEFAPAPQNSTPETVAVEIKGDSLGPALNGWLAFYDDVRSPVTDDQVGRLCVVALEDGRVVIKLLRRSKTRNRYHLFPNGGGEPILDAKVTWAAVVKHLAEKLPKF